MLQTDMRKGVYFWVVSIWVFLIPASFVQAQNQPKFVQPIIDFEITHYYQEKVLRSPNNQRLFRFLDKYVNEDVRFEDLKYSDENFLKRFCKKSDSEEGSLLNQTEIEKLRKEYFKLSYRERYAVFHTLGKNENKKELLDYLYEDKIERFSFDLGFTAQDQSSLPPVLENYLAQMIEQFETDMARLMSAKEKDIWFTRLIIIKYLHILKSSYDPFIQSYLAKEKKSDQTVSNRIRASSHVRLIRIYRQYNPNTDKNDIRNPLWDSDFDLDINDSPVKWEFAFDDKDTQPLVASCYLDKDNDGVCNRFDYKKRNRDKLFQIKIGERVDFSFFS